VSAAIGEVLDPARLANIVLLHWEATRTAVWIASWPELQAPS